MVRPRIGIDARLYGVRDRGIGRYVEDTVRLFDELQSHYAFVIFIRSDQDVEDDLRRRGYEVVTADFPVYSFVEQFQFPSLIRRENIDVMFFPHLNVPLTYRHPFVMTVHDLILHHFPDRRASSLNPIFYWLKYCGYRLVVRMAVWRAWAIIAVSHFTAEDLTTFYPGAAKKIAIIGESVAPFVEKKDLANDTNSDVVYTPSRPYVLIVGAFYPHKNIERVLRVWKKIAPKEQLVIVGRLDFFGQRVQSYAKTLGFSHPEDKVVFLEAVSDVRLQGLYQHASFLLVPSLFEGFGLPGLEALALGTPVVSSSLTVIPEIYSTSAHYLPVTDDDQMAEALEQLFLKDMRPVVLPSVISKQEIVDRFHSLFQNIFQNH